MNSIQIRDMDDLGRFAKMVAKAGYFGMTPEQAAIKITAGMELGIGPLQALMNVHVIKSGDRTQVTLAAGLVASLIKRSGRYDYRIKTSTSAECVLTFTERLGETTRETLGNVSWTIQEAKTAGLASKHNWKTYPADMLFARALTRGARRFCPDVFGGPIYTPDEISGDPTGVPDMEIKPEPAMGGDHEADAIRDQLLEDLITLRGGNPVPWLSVEIATDPVGGNSWFGPEVRWTDGVLDTPEQKAVRQRFHIWTKEAGNAYDDVRQWPLYAIKGQGVINYNRALRQLAEEITSGTQTASDEDGDTGAVPHGDGPQGAAQGASGADGPPSADGGK